MAAVILAGRVWLSASLERLRELGEAVVVALEHRRDDLLVPAEHAAEREDEKREARRPEKQRGDGQGDGGV